MAIPIGGHNFEGPYDDVAYLRNASGVYVILGHRQYGNPVVVDVGESGDIRARVSAHDRRNEWVRQGHRRLTVAALYVNEFMRMTIERHLRLFYRPPCGIR
jgi:hypothetical protein